MRWIVVWARLVTAATWSGLYSGTSWSSWIGTVRTGVSIRRVLFFRCIPSSYSRFAGTTPIRSMVTPVRAVMSMSRTVSPVWIITVVVIPIGIPSPWIVETMSPTPRVITVVIIPVWIPSPRVTPTERSSPSPAVPTGTYVVTPCETIKTRIVPNYGPNVFWVITEN